MWLASHGGWRRRSWNLDLHKEGVVSSATLEQLCKIRSSLEGRIGIGDETYVAATACPHPGGAVGRRGR